MDTKHPWKNRFDHPQYEVFNEWFMSLLRSQGTCLLRDVLRDSKPSLWESWKVLEPVKMEM